MHMQTKWKRLSQKSKPGSAPSRSISSVPEKAESKIETRLGTLAIYFISSRKSWIKNRNQARHPRDLFHQFPKKLNQSPRRLGTLVIWFIDVKPRVLPFSTEEKETRPIISAGGAGAASSAGAASLFLFDPFPLDCAELSPTSLVAEFTNAQGNESGQGSPFG
jgi:hypothetical protein